MTLQELFEMRSMVDLRDEIAAEIHALVVDGVLKEKVKPENIPSSMVKEYLAAVEKEGNKRFGDKQELDAGEEREYGDMKYDIVKRLSKEHLAHLMK